MMRTDTDEKTAGGVAGSLIGKAKEAAGSLIGDDDLRREGALQRAHSEVARNAEAKLAEAKQDEVRAEVEIALSENEVERERLRSEVDAERRKEKIEQDRRQAELAATQQETAESHAAEAERARVESVSHAHEEQAVQSLSTDGARAARLAQEAERAETRAEKIDPEENR